MYYHKHPIKDSMEGNYGVKLVGALLHNSSFQGQTNLYNQSTKQLEAPTNTSEQQAQSTSYTRTTQLVTLHKHN